MSNLTSILTLRQSAETSVNWMMQRLQLSGFQVERTFDLRAARVAQQDCACPYHGTGDCTCQMIILLVHSETRLATVVAHGHDGCTILSLVDGENKTIDRKVVQALLPAIDASGH